MLCNLSQKTYQASATCQSHFLSRSVNQLKVRVYLGLVLVGPELEHRRPNGISIIDNDLSSIPFSFDSIT